MKSINKVLAVMSVLFAGMSASAQTEGVSIKTTSGPPHASAMLDIESASKGLLIPRVNISALGSASPVTSPATGLLIYNPGAASVTAGFYYWNSSAWTPIASGANSSYWSPIGTNTVNIQYGAGMVRLGTGTTQPTYQFEVDKPSEMYIARYKGTYGEMRFGLNDVLAAGSSTGNILTQMSYTNGSNYIPMRYAQVHGNGVLGLDLTTWDRPIATATSVAGWCTINANNNTMYIGGQQSVVFVPYGFTGASPAAYFDVSGNFVNPSDSTRKTNITDMSAMLPKILQARPVTYRWKSQPSGQTNYGLIAQEVESIWPLLVSEYTNLQDEGGSSGGGSSTIKGVNYIALTAILIKGIQEQQAQIDSLKTRVTALENK